MKKILAILISLSMMAYPVYAQEGYTTEELVAAAKDTLSISDIYTEFEISYVNEVYNNVFYTLAWTDKEGENSVDATIDSNGIIYRYNNYTYTDSPQGTQVLTPDSARSTAETFLKKALKSEYDNLVYDSYNNSSESYIFYYDICLNDIPYYNTLANVFVNKYTGNVTSYEYPYDLTGVTNNGFENTKTLTEANSALKEYMEPGYIADYDYSNEEYNIKLIYRLKEYILKADDLAPLSFEDIYGNEKGAGYAESANASADFARDLTPEELEGIAVLHNAITVDRALEILRNTFDISLTADDVNIHYEMEYDTNKYSVSINSKSEADHFNCTIDSEGRITNYYRYKDAEPTDKISKDDAYKKANDLLGRFHYGYQTKELEEKYTSSSDNYYSFTSNVIRNGYTSFDEYINIEIAGDGTISSVSANYLPDELFADAPKADISTDEAYNTLSAEYPPAPYYYIRYDYSSSDTRGDTIAVYAFRDRLSVDALTGEVLDYYGNEIDTNEVKEYTDLTDQWYADYARDLAYMGYYFDSEEFRGDDPLTYGDLQELNKSRYIGSVDLEENSETDNMTRYQFAEYIVDAMNIKGINKYNEIYITPFEDVAYQYTGTVAILKAMGVVNGDTFRGNDVITRGEACAMIYRSIMNQ